MTRQSKSLPSSPRPGHKRRKMFLFYSSFQTNAYNDFIKLILASPAISLSCGLYEKSVLVHLTHRLPNNNDADDNDGCCMCTASHQSPHQHPCTMMCIYYEVEKMFLLLREIGRRFKKKIHVELECLPTPHNSQITSLQLMIGHIGQAVSHHVTALTPMFASVQVMWVCNLCRKQQEILTKSGAWFYGSGPGQVRGVFEGGPQGKKAKLQDPSLYPYQGTSGDSTPASDRSRPHGGLLPRQASLDNGSGLRYPGPGDAATDRSAGNKSHMGVVVVVVVLEQERSKGPTVNPV